MNKLPTKLTAISYIILATSSQFTFANEPAETEEKDIERITITGSHLKGVDLEGAQPLISLSEQDIKDSGASTISELMKNIGATRGGTGSFNTSTSGTSSNSSPAGMAAASLRGLGASSTLTLVNGRRIAASSFALGNANFVDVNSIPLAAIKRVDVLATGASATYGADAIAGAINYVLKDDYDGVALDINYGNSTADTDDSKLSVNFVLGAEVGDGGNITAFADFYQKEAFSYADRDITATTFSPTTASPYATLNYRDSFSGYNEVDPSCPSELLDFDDNYGGFGDAFCTYDPNPQTQVNPDFRSISGGFVLNMPLSDETTVFSELLFSSTESNATSSSARFRNADDSSRVAVPTDHPNFPEQWISGYGDSIPDSVMISGRFIEQRKIDVKTDSLRFIFGLEGELGDWQYDTAINYSLSESEQVAVSGIVNRAKFNAALMGELCQDGATDCGPEDGGIWYNPFGTQSGNSQVLSLIEEQPDRDGTSEVLGWDLKFNGEINEIPVAFGLEARTEKIDDEPSDLAVAQLENDYIVDVIDFGSSRVSADRSQWAAFVEANFNLAEGIDLNTALRYDHYSDFGGDVNPKLGLRWEVNEDLLVRASWATSFRAPSLSQSGAKLRTTSFEARCLPHYQGAFCGDAVEITPNSLEVGNPNLQAEEAQSTNIGLVYSPNKDITLTADYWQYQHEKVVDVDGEGFLAQAYLNPQEYLFCGLVPEGQLGVSIDPYYCTYDVNGVEGETLTLEQLSVLEGLGVNDLLYRDHVLQLENIGEQTTKGLDFTYTQYIDFNDDSELKLSVDVTHIMEFERNRTALAEKEQLAGSFRYPETIANFSLRWSYNDLSLGMSAYYTGSYEDEMFTLSEFDLLYIEQNSGVTLYDDNGTLAREVESWLTIDTFVSYRFSDNIRASISINNATDKEPPFVYGGYRNVDFINHDSMGRYYNLGVEIDF